MDQPKNNNNFSTGDGASNDKLETELSNVDKLTTIDTSSGSNNESETPVSSASFTSEHTSEYKAPSTMVAAPPATSSAPSSRRFLAAYITSILSGLSLLSSGAFLGYSLLDHFLSPKESSQLSMYFDLSPLYLALITSMMIFGTLYLLTSQYIARQVAKDTVGVKDWRVYRVVYAGFTAVLLTLAASVIGSLLYIPLAVALVVQDYESHHIWIQVLGGLHVLVWIGVLIWQERLVKHGKNVALQGVATGALAVLIIVLSGIFLVANKVDERYDKRASSDLGEIQSTITTYRSNNAGKLPADLDALDFSSTPPIEKRLDDYKYTVKQPKQNTQRSSSELSRQMQMLGGNSTDVGSYDIREDSYDRYSQDNRYQTTRPSYELCATFRTDTTKNTESPFGTLMGGTSSETSFYKHGTGEVCFERD